MTVELTMQITAKFDSGNINVIEANDPQNISLEIVKDNQSDYYQWFHFKLHKLPTFHAKDLCKTQLSKKNCF